MRIKFSFKFRFHTEEIEVVAVPLANPAQWQILIPNIPNIVSSEKFYETVTSLLKSQGFTCINPSIACASILYWACKVNFYAPNGFPRQV